MTHQHPAGRALSPSERPADPSAPTASPEALLRAQTGAQRAAARYRHRTPEVEAIQWTGHNADALRAFAGPDFDEIELADRIEDPDETAAVRESEHGTWRGLKPGDWVVRLDGGLYEFSAADFVKQYEPAPADSPPSTHQAAVLADKLVERCPDHGWVLPEWEDGCHCEMVPLLRRRAAETPQPKRPPMDPVHILGIDAEPQPETQAHPPHHRWSIETRDDDVDDQWAPGTPITDRSKAVERYEHVTRNWPTWKDGTPVQRRLVRATTTYTVEAPAVPEQPAAADDQPTRPDDTTGAR